MLTPKIAAVMSSLTAPIKGKPMAAPAPRPKTPSTPGLGAKMREETSRSLEKMLKEGAFTTGLESLVKVARGASPTAPPTQVLSSNIMRSIRPQSQASPLDGIVGSDAPDMMAPKPRASVSMDEAHQNLARMRPDPQKAMGVIGLPEARVVRGGAGSKAPAGGAGAPPRASGGGKLPPVPAAPASAGGGGSGGFKMPRMGRTMGLMGLGAAGALAYGMHRQNEEDRQKRSLIYAPLPGSVMQ